MKLAKSGDAVTVHYTGQLSDGTVFDSSVGGQPLQFSLGQGSVIPGFEQAVIGMKQGESKTVTITSDRAYGPYRPDMTVVVDRQQIPADISIQVGQQLQIARESGQAIPVIVQEISESKVTLDANHPLAGEDLTFEIELVKIN